MSRSVSAPFQELQRRFAAHIRDPDRNPAPENVSPRRMAVYTELFFRNIEQLLADGFPVIRRISPDPQWQRLVRLFMARHRCRTPLFPRLGREFAMFLRNSEAKHVGPPFLADLADYEQLELEVALAEESKCFVPGEAAASLLDRRLALSACARVVRFDYPVHRIGPDYQPEAPPGKATYLLVYRDRDERVRFMELNAFSYTLLQLLCLGPAEPALAVLQSLAEAFAHPDSGEVIRAGHEFLQQLAERGVLAGSR